MKKILMTILILFLLSINSAFAQGDYSCVSTSGHAPANLYRLIKPTARITPATVGKMKNILDLVWTEPSGQILLTEVLKHRVPIRITQGAVTANSMRKTAQRTYYGFYGLIPLFSSETSSLSINIAFNYLVDFYSPSISQERKLYDLQVVIHELGHTFMLCKNHSWPNSIEEELSTSMLGYNSAYKILTGSYLTREQTEEYSMSVLQSLLSDDHRNLPLYNGFPHMIQKYGIKLPYPEVYSNLPQMYKKLLYEGKVAPVPSFYVYGR